GRDRPRRGDLHLARRYRGRHPATRRLTSDGRGARNLVLADRLTRARFDDRHGGAGWASGTGGADGPGQFAPGAADLTDHRMHARGPGSLVGVGVGLGQPGRVQLRVEVAAEPALAALPRLRAKGGAAWPAAARHAEVAVDLAVMRP